ncbi:MAG: arylsulfotransferase family protein, partial [Pseudomonadota bacterium]
MRGGAQNGGKGPGRDPARVIFYGVLAVLSLGLVFILGLHSGHTRNAAHGTVVEAAKTLRLVLDETRNWVLGGDPVHFLQPARHVGTGVTLNKTRDDKLVLISGFFDGSTELRLIERDGTVLARWPVAYSDTLPLGDGRPSRPNTDWNVDIHGAVAMPDGSVVFNWEYNGTQRMSRCGDAMWVLDDFTHHSLERAEGGGFWIPGRRVLPSPDGDATANPFPPFTGKPRWDVYYDDLILRVSDEGEVLEEVSVMQVLYDSGLAPVLTATGFSFWPTGGWDTELVHLNKITELPADLAGAFPGFEMGDLLISLRQYNLIAVIDPKLWRVRWHQTGPWVRQHDPEFLPDGTIAVFDNGHYRTDFG